MRISEIRNPDLFQSLCQHVLVAEHPDAQIVDDSRGDAGVDAYVPSTRTLYAMYCPEKVPVPKEYYQKKIRDDLGKAVTLRDSLGYAIDHWVLMTPAPLTEELHRYLKEKATDSSFTSGANQSETHLVTLLAKHPHLRSLFSQLITPDLEAQLEKVYASLSSQLVDQQLQPPALEIQFADLKKRTPLGLTAELESEVVELPDESAFPAYRGGGMFGIGDNEDYWWDKALYIRDTALIRELGLVVKNTSPAAAQNVRAEITVSKVDGARVLRTSKYPSKPKARTLGGLTFDFSRMPTINSKSVDVDEYVDRWLVTAEFGTVQPRAEVYSDYTFLVGSLKPCSLRLEVTVRADNLSEPVMASLIININTKVKALTVKEVYDYRLGDDE